MYYFCLGEGGGLKLDDQLIEKIRCRSMIVSTFKILKSVKRNVIADRYTFWYQNKLMLENLNLEPKP